MARLIILRRRARSNVGIKRSTTRCCWRTITCQATSKRRSGASSSTTTTADTIEGIDNLTPADVYFGRGQAILLERERIKRETIEHRRLLHRKLAA